MQGSFEVIIVGGSYAGLSAAMALGRSRRKVLVLDSGDPCNAQTPHSHNFLTQDGKTPGEISAVARQQLTFYDTVEMRSGLVTKASKTTDGFDIVLQSGERSSCKKLIFATGIKDQLPDLAGFSSCWGISVIHCPYCHGYEHRGKHTAILANGEAAIHYAILVANLTDKLEILTNGNAEFGEEQLAKLQERGITIHESEVVEIEHRHGHLTNVVMKGGDKLPFDALYFRPPFKQHSDIPQLLGCEVNDHGYLIVDELQKTTIEGVFACGDNSSMMRSVANAVSSGNMAGAAVNKELASEQF